MQKQYSVEFEAPKCPACGAELQLSISGVWEGPLWSRPTMTADWGCECENGELRSAAVEELPLAILEDISERIRQWRSG